MLDRYHAMSDETNEDQAYTKCSGLLLPVISSLGDFHGQTAACQAELFAQYCRVSQLGLGPSIDIGRIPTRSEKPESFRLHVAAEAEAVRRR